jgi:hypothetical protein
MSDRKPEGFIGRWSRRKLDPQAQETTPAAPKPTESFADFDFDALDFASDYRRFMAEHVPDDVRNTALRRLWSSTDIIAQPDELDDYLEDFREEAKALPAELARSAYRIGRGFLEPAEDEKAAAAEDSEGQNEAEPAAAVSKPTRPET